MARTLRSKQLRYLLWRAANGKCQICGCDLDPDNWHADHIVPWCRTGRTNVHEMQAVCPACNLKKGSKMQLRSHQLEFQSLCERIASGQLSQPLVVSNVAPGGGKSTLPIIAAKRLIPRVADKICIVVPKLVLRRQGADQFMKPQFRDLFKHTLSVREATNQVRPWRDSDGWITTYQALCADTAGINREAMESKRCILVLDEFHHAEVDSATHAATKMLVERAAQTFLLTGTLERGDKGRIAYLPYRDLGSDSQGVEVNTSATGGCIWINYPIAAARREQAITDIGFHHADGMARYIDSDGATRETESFGDNRDALFAALNSDYAFHLLKDCCTDWIAHRKRNPRSKLLVVCADVNQANRMHQFLQDDMGVESRIATYKEEQARASITKFQKGDVSALVTVHMAYEGFDVPEITHLACLTEIRSAPWILQMFARAWRWDSDPDALPYAAQKARAYVPDDDRMNAVIEYIHGEMRSAVADRGDDDQRLNGNGKGCGLPPVSDATKGVVPLTSSITDSRATDWNGEQLSPEEMAKWQFIAESCDLIGIDPFKLKQAAEMADSVPAARRERAGSPDLTPTERESALRNAIKSHCGRYESIHKLPWGTLNTTLLNEGFPKRNQCGESDLRREWAFIQDKWPL